MSNTFKNFEVNAAGNGGFVVLNKHEHPGFSPQLLAAFTNATDMIAWLAKQHGVPFGGFDVPAEMIEVVKGAIVGNGALGDAWVEWKGGKCPVKPTTMVHVKFRHGGITESKIAKVWSWEHRAGDDLNNGGDIVAYRVI